MKPKIAYTFLVYGDMSQPRLWEEYFKGHEDTMTICCHAANQDETHTPWLKDNLIPCWVSTMWGKLGLVIAQLELIRYALRDPDVQRVAFCSGSCVPIKPWHKIYDIAFSENKSRFCHTTQWTNRMSKTTTIPKKHFRKNSQWVFLTRDHAELLIRYNFTGDFARCVVPDEHYVSTVMCHLGELHNVIHTDQSDVNWGRISEVQSTPKEYVGELNPIDVERFKNSTAFFARKFASSSNIIHYWDYITQENHKWDS